MTTRWYVTVSVVAEHEVLEAEEDDSWEFGLHCQGELDLSTGQLSTSEKAHSSKSVKWIRSGVRDSTEKEPDWTPEEVKYCKARPAEARQNAKHIYLVH